MIAEDDSVGSIGSITGVALFICGAVKRIDPVKAWWEPIIHSCPGTMVEYELIDSDCWTEREPVDNAR